jgi:hypothetical protein
MEACCHAVTLRFNISYLQRAARQDGINAALNYDSWNCPTLTVHTRDVEQHVTIPPGTPRSSCTTLLVNRHNVCNYYVVGFRGTKIPTKILRDELRY